MHRLDRSNSIDRFEKCFMLFAECIPVKGAMRSIIYDLGRSNYDFIPNDLYSILVEYEGNSYESVLSNFDKVDHPIIEEYFDFLEEKEYIFWCDKEEKQLFPKLDTKWDYPSKITNAVIDIDEESEHDFSNLLTQLLELGCQYVQFRFFTWKSKKYIQNILNAFEESILKRIEIFMPYTESMNLQNYESLLDKYPRLKTFIVYGAKELYQKSENKNFVFIPIKISKGSIPQKDMFYVNLQLYMESQFHNVYLNRKVSIDTNGAIKNCNSYSLNFGFIGEKKLKDVVNSSSFKKLSSVTKDSCKICKDCEFRYMCVDGREPILGDNGEYSHNLACDYDPYTTDWKNKNLNIKSR